jgi:hypothetical protein
MDTNHVVLKRAGGFEFWRDSTGAVYVESVEYHSEKLQIDQPLLRFLDAVTGGGPHKASQASPIPAKPSVSPKPAPATKWPTKLILTFAAGLLLGMLVVRKRKKS